MSVALTSIDRLSADIVRHLSKRKLIRDSIRIRDCYGHKHCHNAYCIKCTSRKVYKQRNTLNKFSLLSSEAIPATSCGFSLALLKTATR